MKGEFKDGSTVVVDAKADNIIFAKKEIAASTGWGNGENADGIWTK